MRSQQDKVFDLLERLIALHGFEPVHRPWAGNCGTIAFQPPNTLHEYGHVTYDFQDSTMKFSITVGSRKLVPFPDRPDYGDFYMRYGENEKFDEFYRRLEEALRAVRSGALP